MSICFFLYLTKYSFFISSYVDAKFVVPFLKHLKEYSKTKNAQVLYAISEAVQETKDERVHIFLCYVGSDFFFFFITVDRTI